MAVDIFFGAIIGFVAMGIVWAIKAHEARTKYTVQSEKDWAEVQADVDKVVTKLERIVYRPRP
jgi:hypothetical protein